MTPSPNYQAETAVWIVVAILLLGGSLYLAGCSSFQKQFSLTAAGNGDRFSVTTEIGGLPADEKVP
jgi:hypothetical protein